MSSEIISYYVMIITIKLYQCICIPRKKDQDVHKVILQKLFNHIFCLGDSILVECKDLIGYPRALRFDPTEAQTTSILLPTMVLGASEVSENLYCNSRTSVLGRLRYVTYIKW